MAEGRARVLIADDQPPNIMLMRRALETKYEVFCATSGKECLAQVVEVNPDIILLDVSMPGLNGYDVCYQLKSMPEYCDIPVLFLSAYDEIEDKLKGYEAGGDDYLTKPYNIREVISKVNATLTFREMNRRRIEEAALVAHTALSYNAELAAVIEFLTSSFACDSYYAVANLLLKTLAEFGLKASVQLRGKYEVVNLTGDGVECSPLEAELLTKLNHKQRIVTFNTHASFYFTAISLIVKNMPVEDPAKSSRLQEHIAALITGAQARIPVLNAEMAQQHTVTAKLDNELTALHGAIAEVKDQFNEHEKQTSAIIDDLLSNINAAFEQQHLTAEQQDFFIRLTNNTMEKIVAHYASGTQIDKYITSALERLRRLTV